MKVGVDIIDQERFFDVQTSSSQKIFLASPTTVPFFRGRHLNGIHKNGMPFWVSEWRLSPGDDDLRLLNSLVPIFHNNHILKSLNICLQGKVHLIRYTLHKYVCHKIVINYRRLVVVRYKRVFQEVPLRCFFNNQCIGQS